LSFKVFTEKQRLLLTFFLLSGGFSLVVQALFTGDGGKGLVIAVPIPEMRGRLPPTTGFRNLSKTS